MCITIAPLNGLKFNFFRKTILSLKSPQQGQDCGIVELAFKLEFGSWCLSAFSDHKDVYKMAMIYQAEKFQLLSWALEAKRRIKGIPKKPFSTRIYWTVVASQVFS